MSKSITKNQARQPYFSIIIPTLNEEKYLPKLLADLAKQTSDSFEVIHVDGSSEDKTVSEAKKFANKIALQSFVVKKRNVAFQRNYGASKAKGKWLVFVDADNNLPRYFLDGLKYQLAKRANVDTFTTWLELDNGGQLNKAIERTINYSFELYKVLGKDVAMGAMIGARRDIFNRFQFDERQKVYEDTLFIQQTIKHGYNYDIFHEPRYSTSLRRMEKEGKLKMILMIALMNLRYLQGKDFSSINHGYVMQGGGYYAEESSSQLQNFQKFIKNTSKKQLWQARKVWNYIKSELEND